MGQRGGGEVSGGGYIGLSLYGLICHGEENFHEGAQDFQALFKEQ